MSKEISITELQAERDTLKQRCNEIIQNAKQDGERRMTTEETKEFDKACLRMREIDMEIDNRQQSLRAKGIPVSNKEKFSLRRAILNAATRSSQTDAELSVMERAEAAHRGSGCDALTGQIHIPLAEERAMFTAATEAATGVVVEEEQKEMLLPLQANLVLSQAGVRMMTGLKGNISWPSFTDVDVYWEGENTTAKDAGGKFNKGTLVSPVRLTATAAFSKQLLVQDNIDVEVFIRNRIAQRMAQKIEETAFSKEKLSEYAPKGIFTDADLAVSGAMSWANIVEMETNAAVNNALFGNLAYIMHPKLRGVAKTKVKDASGAGGFIVDGNGQGLLNGYKALATTNIASGLGESADQYGIVFGNWQDFFIGQWGALDLTVDPYTRSKESIIEITLTMWANMGMIRPESFTVGALK